MLVWEIGEIGTVTYLLCCIWGGNRDSHLFIVLYLGGGEKRVQASPGGALPVPVFRLERSPDRVGGGAQFDTIIHKASLLRRQMHGVWGWGWLMGCSCWIFL